MTAHFGKRFFDSTRGRIVTLLRGDTKTVNDLAAELNLTDNAVRAHLTSLERDGLVKQGGVQRGTRKPHFSYELTPEADSLFPKAYDLLVNQLIAVLKGHMTPDALTEILREVGRSLASDELPVGDLETRIDKALHTLEAIGANARLGREGETLVIKGHGCPLSSAVAEHPEICQLTEALLAELIGAEVRERCEREGAPQCSFEIHPATS
jgi:predicted ArsR family transcriptional regulator